MFELCRYINVHKNNKKLNTIIKENINKYTTVVGIQLT